MSSASDSGPIPVSKLDLETLAAKELHRSRRYGRSFSVAVFTLHDVDGLSTRAGQNAAQAVARALVSAVSRIVRDADTLARVSEVEHLVLLPETDHFGALVFQRRASEEIHREPAMRALGEGASRLVSIGAATFPRDGEDLGSLLQVCRARQAERRSSMLSQPGAQGFDPTASFWDLVDALLETARIPTGSPSARIPLEPELFDSVEREAAREIGRDPRVRGVLYLARPGGGDGQLLAELPQLRGALRKGETGSRVYVVGPRSAGREHPLVAHVPVNGDRRFERHAFLLFFSEAAAYALLQGADGRTFHTSDAPLVEALVAKLQAQYGADPSVEPNPFLFTGEGKTPEAGRPGQRLAELVRRSDGRAGDSTLQGSLAQIQLVDLLQILAVNRRTGRLELSRDGARAAISLDDGRVTDAQAGPSRGEKALYRLLTWRDGQFTLGTGKSEGRGRIEKRLEELLLEGLRQSDEAARLLPSLPVAEEQLALAVPRKAMAEVAHPVTAEVISLLARPRSLQEVLDAASASDLEVLRAVAALLASGHVRREARPPAGAVAPPFLGARELDALRRRIDRATGGSASAVGKLVVAGGGPLVRRSALVRFGALPGFSGQVDGGPVAFGTLGRLALDGGACIDLVALPSDPGLAPIWRPFAARAVGTLVLLPADEIAARAAALAGELRIPIGACGPSEASVEPPLRSAPAGYAFLGGDPVEALRALLVLAAEPS